MSNTYKILEKVKNIFQINDDQFSSLLKILEDMDSNNILTSFGIPLTDNSICINEDINIKINSLNSLVLLILENPKFKDIDSKEKDSLMINLYEATASLYEYLIRTSSEYNVDFAQSLVLYGLLSYLADKQTISDLFIKDYYNKIKVNTEDILYDLELETYKLILCFLVNIKNHEILLMIDRKIKLVDKLLEEAQNEEMQNNFSDINRGLTISALANIIHLTRLLKEYLFTGTIKNEETQDIKNLIQMYSYNAYYLLKDNLSNIKLVSYLIKYTYSKIVDDSIWKIASKSPLIKEFIEYNFSDGEKYIYTLLPSQRDAISDILTTKKSIVINMPTSSGKSLLAEMQILFSLHNYKTDNFKPTVCYIVPTNALIGQVQNDLKQDFKRFEFKIETVLPYYDVDEIEDEILNSEHIDILVSTPEKLESLIRQNHPSIKNTKLIILDEAHNISSKSRGSKFELVLSTIKQKMSDVHFVLLSPFIENASEIAEWLGDTKNEAVVISKEWTPTKQYVGCNLLNTAKNKSYLEFFPTDRNQLIKKNVTIDLDINPLEIKEKISDETVSSTVKTIAILERLLEQPGNILVLCQGPSSTRKIAKKVLKYFRDSGKLPDLSNDSKVIEATEIVKLESDESDELINCIKYGICFHNSGLSTLEKETMEELIRKDRIKIIFATTTLAQGMNFPIKTVLFNTTILGGGISAKSLTTAEFWNIAGRAGRAYKDKEGYILLSYASSKKLTREKTTHYITSSIKEVISSLTKFFNDNSMISFDYDFLKNPDNSPLLNLLQYVNHIINVSYNYNINAKDLIKVRTILNNSLLYHNLEKTDGFLKAQTKINAFVGEYINHIEKQSKKDLRSADRLGISDISFSKLKSIIYAYTQNLKLQNEYDYKATDVILKTRDVKRLSEIVDIISKIPEIKISMLNAGKFDPESIAKLLIGWVNGDKINNIAKEIKRDNQSLMDAVCLCNGYLNSKMKSFMPWGVSIYQSLTNDLKSENSKLLPSYIYYGVSSKESVLISKIGVPRFAVENVKNVLKKEYNNLAINVGNIEEIRKVIKTFKAEKYCIDKADSNIIKSIVDSKLK